MIKFRAWYMPFGQDGPMQKMVHGKASSILAFAEMQPDKYIVEQYTGLKDVNGKEIYEGDVLGYWFSTEWTETFDPVTLGLVDGEPGIEAWVRGRVVMWPSMGVMLTGIRTDDHAVFEDYKVAIPSKLHVTKKFEILGNIHENPELLEADHD